MLILKCETFGIESNLAEFVNDNKILRENILTITQASSSQGHANLVIYYYADSETKEKKPFFA